MIVVTFISALIVAAACIVLVFHPDYEDGLIGRAALALICVASVARVMGIIESGFELRPGPIAVTLWFGLALFLTRHLYRFLYWRRNGAHEWRDADSRSSCGKIKRGKSNARPSISNASGGQRNRD